MNITEQHPVEPNPAQKRSVSNSLGPSYAKRDNVKKFVHACFVQGIPKKNVIDAIKNSEDLYNDWWLGKRLKEGESISLTKQRPNDNQLEEETVKQKLSVKMGAPIEVVKKTLLFALQDSKGKLEDNHLFNTAVHELESHYRMSNQDCCEGGPSHLLNNIWLTMTPPSFKECLGKNKEGDEMYTLGRMSFDMFRPTNLVCSLQWAFNVISPITEQSQVPTAIPQSLQEEVGEGNENMRVYNICTAFTVEPSELGPEEPKTPIRGLMTTFGYMLPDPSVKNRFSIWFTGGLLEEASCRETGAPPSEEWMQIFSDPEGRTLSQKINILAAYILLGAQVSDKIDKDDGSLEYSFKRPIGGHGKFYVDMIYLDETLRIMRGSLGTIFVMTRMHGNK